MVVEDKRNLECVMEDKDNEQRSGLKNKCSVELHSTDLSLMIFPQEKSSSRALQ